MENGFFDTIASVIPTVGKVVGNLLVNTFGAEENAAGGYVGFFRNDARDDGLDKAVFTKEGDKIFLCNTSPVTNDYIVYSTPTQYSAESDTCKIPGLARIDVTESFANAVAGGDDRIFLNSVQPKKAADGGGVLTVYGSNNHVDLAKIRKLDARLKLGSWLEIEMEGTQMMIVCCSALAAGTYLIHRIRRIVIHEGNINIDMTDPQQREREPGVVEVRLDQPLPEYAVAAIDMQVELQELPQPNDAALQDERVEMMDESYLQMLLAKKKASKREEV